MYTLYACVIRVPYVYALYVCLTQRGHLFCMYTLYVCVIRVPYVYALCVCLTQRGHLFCREPRVQTMAKRFCPKVQWFIRRVQ